MELCSIHWKQFHGKIPRCESIIEFEAYSSTIPAASPRLNYSNTPCFISSLRLKMTNSNWRTTLCKSKWRLYGLVFRHCHPAQLGRSIASVYRYVGGGSASAEHINSLATGRPRCLFKTAIFNLVLLIGIFTLSNDNALRWMPRDLTDDKSTLVQVMAWCIQATSHYLRQCWPRSLSPYGITRPQWVKFWQCNKTG